MAVRFIRFDRWGTQIGNISGIESAKWSEELNGSDIVTLTIRDAINKGDRVVWRDSLGAWHEHIVSEVETAHDDSGLYCIATCENSISELFGDYILDKRPTNTTAYAALSDVLSGTDDLRSNSTRWNVGTVSVTGQNSTNFYHESCRSCIKKILDKWGGELSTTIEVSGTDVTSRKVNITRRGENRGKRFVYGHNMQEIRRIFDASDVKTALYAYGKGEEVGDGYGRRLDMSEGPVKAQNSVGTYHSAGALFVANDQARALWGRPGRNGGTAHVFGQVEFGDCEDVAELVDLAIAELDELINPLVSYSASVADFKRFGYDFTDSQLGDTVALIDDAEGFEVRVKGRVTKTVRDLLDENSLTSLTIGNISTNFADMYAYSSAKINEIDRRSSAWDVAAYTTDGYMQKIVDRFNERFEDGGVYKYESFEHGTIYSSVPLDENMKPTTTPAKAFQLRGGGFRIADSINTDGTFKWSTMADGAGIIADSITSGIMNANLIRAGIIQDMTGTNFWNLETGELQMTVIPEGLDDAIADVDVEYALSTSRTDPPTSGWSTTAPQWQSGKYMWQRTKTTSVDGNVSYSQPTCIQGADGTSVNILGSYDSYQDLVTAHPMGNRGDGYVVSGDLYVWNGTSWENVGQVQGPAGEQGIGVSAIVEQYYLSTSSTTQTGGSWGTAQPEWAKNKYIWTRSLVTWTNGTQTTTAPVLAKAINGANEKAQSAQDTANTANGKLTQQGIFNLLTNNGALNGIFMKDGNLYINATYLASGIIADAKGFNYWDLTTGNFHISALPPGTYYGTCESEPFDNVKDVVCPGFELKEGACVSVRWKYNTNTTEGVVVTVNESPVKPLYLGTNQVTGNSIAIRANRTTAIVYTGDAWYVVGDDALLRANTAQSGVNTINGKMNQEGIFNLLTANGALKGLFMEDNELYINADYIKSGVLIADVITSSDDPTNYIEVSPTGGLYGITVYNKDVKQMTISPYGLNGKPNAFDILVPYENTNYSAVMINNQQIMFSNQAYCKNQPTNAHAVFLVANQYGLQLQNGLDTNVVSRYIFRTPGNVDSQVLQSGYRAYKNGSCVTISAENPMAITVNGNWGSINIGTLPVGWRPPCMVYNNYIDVDGLYLQVNASGQVSISNSSSNSFTGNPHGSITFCAAN